MKSPILFIILITLATINGSSQQLINATNLQLVTTPNIKLVIHGGIIFNGTTNWTDSGETFIGKNTLGGRENWNDQTTTGAYSLNSTGKINFTSDSLQYITGANASFYTLTVSNDSGIVINNDVTVRNLLNLDKGYVYTGSSKMFVSNSSVNSIQSASGYVTSWVAGILSRATSSTSTYLFPIGKFKNPDTLYAPVKFDKVNTNACVYTAEYVPVPPSPAYMVALPLDHVSKVEYWKITSNVASGPNDDAFLTLSWRRNSIVSADSATRDSLLVAHYVLVPPKQWIAEHNGIGANTGNVIGSGINFGWVKSNKPVGSFTIAEDTFTLGSLSKYNFLPLQILNWDVSLINKEVWASWSVNDDQNVLRYDVERSTDLITFSMTSTLPSHQLPSLNNYLYIDHAPFAGWNYYRLKIIDPLGNYSYTGIKKVYLGNNKNWTIYPNPARNSVNIRFTPGDVNLKTIRLYDIDGKLLISGQSSENNILVNIANLPAGPYIFEISGNLSYGSGQFIKE